MRTGKVLTSLCGSISCSHIMGGSRGVRTPPPWKTQVVAIGFLKNTGMESPREPIGPKGRMAHFEVR